MDSSGSRMEPRQAGAPGVGMKNFFTTQTTTPLPGGSTERVLCYVHPQDAVVLSVEVTSLEAAGKYRFEAQLRKEIKTDSTIQLASLEKAGDLMIAVWTNGTVLA